MVRQPLTPALMAMSVPQDLSVLTKQHVESVSGELAQLLHALYKQEVPHFSSMVKHKSALLVCIVLRRQSQTLLLSRCFIPVLLVLS